MENRLIKLFLRLAIAISFLSAVADRVGMWSKEFSAWGNWNSFLAYVKIINPWVPDSLIPSLGFVATFAEVLLHCVYWLDIKLNYSQSLAVFSYFCLQ